MMEYTAGIDIGSTLTKVLILGEDVLSAVVGPTDPEQERMAKTIMEEALNEAGLPIKAISYIVSTGYGRINVPFADKQVTEISCHAKGTGHLFPKARTIIDIGGQDSKAIKINEKGLPTNFVMNDKCAAGSGRFLEVIAEALEIDIQDMGELSLASKNPARISNLCTVWAEQEVVERLAEGVTVQDLIAGVHESLAARVARMVKRLQVEQQVIFTGGVAKNVGIIQALSTLLDSPVLVPSNPLLTGALGAALLGREIMQKARKKGRTVPKKEHPFRES